MHTSRFKAESQTLASLKPIACLGSKLSKNNLVLFLISIGVCHLSFKHRNLSKRFAVKKKVC